MKEEVRERGIYPPNGVYERSGPPAHAQTPTFSTVSPLLITFGEGKLVALHREILARSVEEFEEGAKQVLEEIRKGLTLDKEEKLVINDNEGEIVMRVPVGRAQLSANTVNVMRGSPYDPIRIEKTDKGTCLLFRIASWDKKDPKKRPELLPEKILQRILTRWNRVDCSRIPEVLVPGVYQQAARLVNAFVVTSYKERTTSRMPSFPNIEEMYDGYYGSRALPASFLRQGEHSPVQFFKKKSTGRVYVFLPLLTAREEFLVARPGETTDWWYKYQEDLEPLSPDAKFPDAGTGIMVAIGLDSAPHKKDAHIGWMERRLSADNELSTIVLKEIESPHPNRKGASGNKVHRGGPCIEWKLDCTLKIRGSTGVLAMN